MSLSSSNRSQIFIFIISLALLALLFGTWTYYNFTPKHPSQSQLILASATLLPQPRDLQNLNLQDTNKKPFTINNLKNHWSLLFFGFTHCPQLCPTTLATLNKTYQILLHNQIDPLPQIIFISVDPQRDSLKRIESYVTGFNPAFIGATGSQQQLDELTKQFNIVYAKIMQNKNDVNYNIDHSGTILLINPQGQWTGIFSTPHNAERIADDLEKIMTR